MKQFIILILITLSTNILVAQDKQWTRGEQRIALIIGNANYPGMNSLCFNNGICPPVNDAHDMEKALKGLGFEVIQKTDLDLKNMEGTIDDFGVKLRTGKYSAALVHFSGHGSEVGGQNYLYPLDASPKSESDTRYECVNVNKILGKLDVDQVETRILLLDACRNNPFEKAWNRSSSEKGLGYINAPDNTFIGFATKPNTTASNLSANGRNGLYTEAILKHIKNPNLTIDELFTKVAQTVKQTAEDNRNIKRQVPFKLSSLSSSFSFASGKTSSSTSSMDSDGDGLVDSVDKCPYEKGPIAQDGCPDRDSDNDGILDKYDECPTKKGPASNNGCPETNTGTFIDARDGQSYTWKKMKDGKKWMTQNLNYEISDSYCYDDEESNCAQYGRLYIWAAAKKACPKGWHLPSDDEWWEMVNKYGKVCNLYRCGKKKNKRKGAGKDVYKALIKEGSSGFTALLGGIRYRFDGFGGLSSYGKYWSATKRGTGALKYEFKDSDIVNRKRSYDYSGGLSCRENASQAIDS